MPNSEIMVSPVGRFINGDLLQKRKVDNDNRPIPEEKQQYEFGVAFRKDDPLLPPLFQKMAAHAWQEYSQDQAAQSAITQAMQGWPNAFGKQFGFSWKIADGDKPNQKGQVSEHSKGCLVFYMRSSFPIRCANAQNAEIPASEVKRGFYVDVAFNVAGNGERGERRGIYINPQFVRMIAHGQEITGGMSAADAFANAPAPTQLPPGASPIPVAPGPMALPQVGNGLPANAGMVMPQGMMGNAGIVGQNQSAPAMPQGFGNQMPTGVPQTPLGGSSVTGFPGSMPGFHKG